MILEQWVDRFEIPTGLLWEVLKIEILGNGIFDIQQVSVLLCRIFF